MKNYHLPVDWDAMQSVIISVLKEDLDQMRCDWSNVIKNNKGFIHSNDPVQDLEYLSEMISAYKKIITYYGGQP